MSGALPQLKILMVDDHPLTLTLLGNILKQLGFINLKEAEDGERALAVISTEDITLLFTDLNMPNLSGVELIRRLRKNEATKELPVIVVSGESDREMVMQALQAGADAFVVKPFSSKIIREKIVQVLTKRVRPAS
jgi:two-component system, chemotaxis family, chemotaxis protein CheY